MLEVLDEIIDRLSPATVRLILDFNSDGMKHSTSVNNLLKDIQRIKINQINKGLKRKIFDLKSKTEENRKYLLKLKKELEILKSLKSGQSGASEQTIKVYALKINELKCKMKCLPENEEDIDLSQLFNEVENLNDQIKDYRKTICVEESKYQCYNGFPPDIEQGRDAIAKLKEKIRHHETIVEFHV